MRKLFLITALLVCMMSNPAHGDSTWTELGLYGFMSGIKGDMKIGIVTVDVDASFSDIVENLDMGFMGFVENRRGKWSLIADVFYVDLSTDKTIAPDTDLPVTLNVGLKQLLTEAFLGYRFFDRNFRNSRFGIDLLGGARYNRIEVDLGVQTDLPEPPGPFSRNPSKEWVDGVVGLRAQYEHSNGWGISGLADIGKGSDSTTYQLIGLVNYRFKNNVRLFGGFRQYSFDYESDSGAFRFGLDADYSGPLMGVSYRF